MSLEPVVQICARKILRVWPGIEEMDELIGDGWIGAIDAVDRFDPAFGASLKTYGFIRVRGEMLDGMRSRHGRKYVDERLDSPKFKARMTRVSLDSPVYDGSRGAFGTRAPVPLSDIIVDEEDEMVRALDRLIIQEAMPLLPEKDSSVLHRYYWSGMTLMQIADEDGVTESRICQVITVAKHRMYQVLTADGTQPM